MKPQSTTSSHVEVNNIESEDELGRLSPSDPHSYANLEAVITTHIHIELETKYYEREGIHFVKLDGFVILYLWKRNKTTKTVKIDAKRLDIESVSDEDSGERLDWKIVKNIIKGYFPSRLGDLVEITLPKANKKILREDFKKFYLQLYSLFSYRVS